MDPTSKTDSLVFEAANLDEPKNHACLFILMECDRPLAPSSRFALDHLQSVIVGRGELRSARRAPEQPSLLRVSIADRFVSTEHAKFSRAKNEWCLDDCSRNGTFVNGQKVNRIYLRDGDIIQAGHTFFLFRELAAFHGVRDLDSHAARPTGPETRAAGLRSLNPILEESFAMLDRVAESDVPILVIGETGTGKELAARAAHERSRRTGPFVPVNCGALAPHLVEGQLFGHKKGAFTGALDDELGLVRSADQGTLFLDEVGELSPAAQVALLRVLQEKEVLPVGGTKAVHVSFRLIAATHRDLGALCEAGRFRSDLLARISGFKLTLPPLATRREDLGMLIASLLIRQRGHDSKIQIDPAAAIAMFMHVWPHNVRELELALQVALAIEPSKVGLAALPAPVRDAYQKWSEAEPDDELEDQTTESQFNLRQLTERNTTLPISVDPSERIPSIIRPRPEDDANRAQLLKLFEEHGGNVSAVARALGKKRTQVQRWMRRYGIDPDKFKG